MREGSGTLASMACGLPYAIGASIAYPDRQVISVIGDGSAAMLMGDFVTLRKYNLNAKIIVIKNNALGQIKWEQMVFLGNPEYGCELEPIDFAKMAESVGINAITIDDPARCGDQLREALATPGPCLIQAVVDEAASPDIPPDKVEVTVAVTPGPDGQKSIRVTVQVPFRMMTAWPGLPEQVRLAHTVAMKQFR